MFEGLRRKVINALSLQSPEGWGRVGGTMSGVSVTPETAMRIAAVYACVKIIAESIGSTPVHIYRKTEVGSERADEHPLATIFGGVANRDNTTQELLEYVMLSLLLHGNSFCEVVRSGGRVIALLPLDPTCMTPYRTEAGFLRYEYKTPSGTVTYLPDNLWRIAGLSGDALSGYSNISQAKDALGVAMAAETHAAKTFRNGASIPGVFQKEGHLTDEGFERLKKQLDDRVDDMAANMMKPLLLEEGLQYTAISMSLKDAQFIEARKFQIAEVARVFRVPLHKLNEMDNSTFSNIEHQALEFVQDTLRPWCTRIEQTIRRDLFTAGETPTHYAKFNLEGLLRGDVKSRYEAHASALVHGWKSRNEVRALEDLNPVEGLDEYLVPLNMGNESENNDEAAAQMRALEKKQYRAITSELGRPDFDEWVEDYYSRLASTIDADPATSKAYCDKQLEIIKASDDVAELIRNWQ